MLHLVNLIERKHFCPFEDCGRYPQPSEGRTLNDFFRFLSHEKEKSKLVAPIVANDEKGLSNLPVEVGGYAYCDLMNMCSVDCCL